jgi:hypothetical protein
MAFFGTTPAKTVDSVVAAFQSTIADLNAVAAEQTAEASRKFDLAAQSLTDAKKAEAEATRATKIAAQMAAVFE